MFGFREQYVCVCVSIIIEDRSIDPENVNRKLFLFCFIYSHRRKHTHIIYAINGNVSTFPKKDFNQ